MSEANIQFQYTIGNDLFNKLYKFLLENADKIAYDINLLLAQAQYEKAKKITEDAIDQFYGSYNPNLYQRTGSLYDIFEIEVFGDDFIFNITDDLMGWHRSNSAVFELDFMQGFHGGKKWRTPPLPNRMTKIEGGSIKWADHSWQYWHYKPAVQTYPPYNTIEIAWNAFINGEYKKLKQQYIEQVISEYI